MDTLESLRRSYIRLAAPAALATAASWSYRHLWSGPLAETGVKALVGPVLFILAAVFAVALPLWHRARFVHRVRGRKGVPLDLFLRFERDQFALALAAIYPALAGYLLDVSRFHFSGAFLLALYAAYYHFPSRRRVAHEMRIFRVDAADGEEG